MKRTVLNQLAVAAMMCLVTASMTLAQINWDGGDGEWNDLDGKWNDGQLADDVFGRTNGLEIGGTEVSNVVNIGSGNVTYDPNTFGDFRFKPAGLAEGETERAPGGELNITGGASLSINTDSDPDGKWTQFDGDVLNLDNGTLRRTQSGDSLSGGAFILGSWRSYPNQVIDVNVVNDSTIDNHGQVWFGAWGDNAPGLTVNMTINNGTLDLKGGFEQTLGPNQADADLVFISDWQDFDAENGGAGAPKGEKYSINFTGPGLISVSDAGIIHAVQDEFGEYNDTDITPVSYQDLWNQGILQAHGYSGFKGAKFDGFFEVEGLPGEEDYVLTSFVTDPAPIVWDGGDGEWNDVGGNWNGGLVANDVMGRTNGLEIGSGEVGFDVHINDGNVTYDPNNFGDFRFRAGGSLNLSGGSLNINTASDVDGKWTEFDGEAINISNGTLSRTQSDPSISGGAFILGSWRSFEDQLIEVSLTEGGRIENHGQLWFGAWGDNAAGLEVIVTINDGALDLTGGDSYDLLGDNAEDGGPGNADLVFINGYENEAPKDENYVINFTGPGSITVDKAGILNPVADGDDGDPASYGDSLTTKLTYEDLWDIGILRANGMSGLDGAAFGEFFSTTGASGENDYMLTSLLNGGTIMLGDCNGDGMVDAADLACIVGSDNGTVADVLDATGLIAGDLNADGIVGFPDFLLLSANFGKDGVGYVNGDIDGSGGVGFPDFLQMSANFGKSGQAAASVPEPSTSLLLGLGALMGLAIRRRR